MRQKKHNTQTTSIAMHYNAHCNALQWPWKKSEKQQNNLQKKQAKNNKIPKKRHKNTTI